MAIEEPQDLVPGERIAGRYRIESLLGRGGMGTVYAATNDLTTRPVALKAIPLGPELHSPMVKRFRAEARAMGRISHPNVIEVFDLFQERKQLFLVMERLHGRVLADAIEGRRMPFVDACRVIWDALQGIDAAHAKGVVHRDLKPENIFLCEDDRGVLVRVKVLDFGVAKFAAGVGTTLTATGALVGTPYYMSPEQIAGSTAIDHRTDIYSMAVVLFELVTGEPPFSGDTLGELAMRIVSGKRPRVAAQVPGTPEGFDALLDRAMAVDPSVRFATALEFADALLPFTGLSRAELEARSVDLAGASDRSVRSAVRGSSVPEIGVQAVPSKAPAVTAPSAPDGHAHAADVQGPGRTRRWATVGIVLTLGVASLWWLARRGHDEPAPPAAQAPNVDAPPSTETASVTATASTTTVSTSNEDAVATPEPTTEVDSSKPAPPVPPPKSKAHSPKGARMDPSQF